MILQAPTIKLKKKKWPKFQSTSIQTLPNLRSGSIFRFAFYITFWRERRNEKESLILARPRKKECSNQARNQDFMCGGANEAKVDQTTEMYFLLSDPFI